MQKPVQITFRNIDHSDFLEGLVRERIERLSKFHPDILGCRVVIEVPHRSSESAKVPLGIAVEVEIPGRPVIVAKGKEDRRESKSDHLRVVSRAFDAVQRQLSEVTDILGGASKQHGTGGEAGVVVRLFLDQSYGFVEVKGSPDLYFTRGVVVGGDFENLEVGTIVQVTRSGSEGPLGPQASSVRLLDARRSVA